MGQKLPLRYCTGVEFHGMALLTRRLLSRSTENRQFATASSSNDDDEAAWNSNFELLRKYKEENGDCHVPDSFEVVNTKLGQWVLSQIEQYRQLQEGEQTSLKPERIKRLESIGFDWDPQDVGTKWNARFELLCRFQRVHGNCLVPQRHTMEGVALGKWVNRQRNEYLKHQEGKPSQMTPDRIEKLEQIGFEWDALSALWTSQFQLLRKYRDDHGDCLIPYSSPLGEWVRTQRKERRKLLEGKSSSMTADRVKKLESLGFNWEPRDEQWERVCKFLRKDIEVHGNRVIPDKYKVEGVDLQYWVRRQRKDYRAFQKGLPSPMTLERMEKLKKIGFDFDPIETKWNQNLDLARQYREMHGHFKIPKRYGVSGVNLGSWLQRQLHQYRLLQEGKKSSMTPERIEKLSKIGFALDAPPLISSKSTPGKAKVTSKTPNEAASRSTS